MPSKKETLNRDLAPYYCDIEQQLSNEERAILRALQTAPGLHLHQLGRKLGLKATELRSDLHRLTEKSLICTTDSNEQAYKLTRNGELVVKKAR